MYNLNMERSVKMPMRYIQYCSYSALIKCLRAKQI